MSTTNATSGYGLSAVGTAAWMAAPVLDYLPRAPRSYRPRIALIGCGGIAVHHLCAYRTLQLDVAMLCDRHPARAEARRAEFCPGAVVVTDWREVMRRDDIAVVDIATHPLGRAEIITAALEADKHVLSQKPFVHDLDEGYSLVALAEKHERYLAVNQNGRWAPHLSYIAAAVRAGLLGEISSIDFALHWDHTWIAGTAYENVRDLILFDFGIHWFDATARLMKGRRATRVLASAAPAGYQRMRPPMLAQAAIEYPDAQARLAFNGHVRHGQEDRTVVCGSHGTIRSFGPSLSEQTIEMHTVAGYASFKPSGTWFEQGFQGAMTELLCAIEESRPPDNSARENLRSLELCFAALASAATGVPQEPGSASRLP